MCVAELVDGELIRVRLVITAALSEIEGRVTEAICEMCDGFFVEASYGALDPSAGGSSNQS